MQKYPTLCNVNGMVCTDCIYEYDCARHSRAVALTHMADILQRAVVCIKCDNFDFLLNYMHDGFFFLLFHFILGD